MASVAGRRVAVVVAGVEVARSLEKAFYGIDCFAADRYVKRCGAIVIAIVDVGSIFEQAIDSEDRSMVGRAMQGGSAYLVNGVDVVNGFGHRE